MEKDNYIKKIDFYWIHPSIQVHVEHLCPLSTITYFRGYLKN